MQDIYSVNENYFYTYLIRSKTNLGVPCILNDIPLINPGIQ